MLRAGLVLFAIAGCDVGEVPLNGGGGDGGVVDSTNTAGAASFNSMIAPLVTECTVSGCHNLQIPVLTSFEALGARYKMKPGSSNVLVTKGASSIPAGTHSGIPYLTTAEQATVAAWIDSL
jgi:hypothetical protein